MQKGRTTHATGLRRAGNDPEMATQHPIKRRSRRSKWVLTGSALATLAVLNPACGTNTSPSHFDAGAPALSDATTSGADGLAFDTGPACNGEFECAVPQCEDGKTTTLTGTVYDPAGVNPLYNAIVYIPATRDAALEPIITGATCDQCATSIKNAFELVQTNAKGEFTFTRVPAGNDIPLVIQVGKWRRKITIPTIEKCVENRVAKGSARLPKKQSEGDMPQMAVVTGGCDPLACLFSRIGIDESEFTSPTGTGRMHVYKGEGNSTGQGELASGKGIAPKPESNLWNSVASLKRYDIALLSCECNEHEETKLPSARDNMKEFLNAGGRVFATHYHYVWLKGGKSEPNGAFESIATWLEDGVTASDQVKFDTTFPKGQALADWMTFVAPGEVVSNEATFVDIKANVKSVKAAATRWIYSSGSVPDPKYISFNTPIDEPESKQCGRGVYSDIHVSSERGDDSAIPTSCEAGALTVQEKALEFLFFDLSSCISNEKGDPKIPH